MKNLLRTLIALLSMTLAVFANAQERPWDEAPMQVRAIPAVYPDSLKDEAPSGVVTLSVVIDEQGNVQGTKVLRSSRPEFVAPAQEAAAQYKFRPAKKDGKPVAASVVISVRFQKTA